MDQRCWACSNLQILSIAVFFLLSAISLRPCACASNHQTCNHLKNSSSEDLLSPDYPNASPFSVKRCWTINAPKGKHVAIRSRGLNVGGPGWDCTQGYLEIWDGCGADSFLVEKICSRRFMSDQRYLWVSTGSCVVINFNSAGGSTNKFFLSISFITSSCNGVLQGNTSGILTIHDSLPSDQQECVWIIAMPKDKIELKFINDFNIRGRSPGCKDADMLRIQNGRFSSSELLKTFCGHTRPYPIYSTEPHLRVTLKSQERSMVQGNYFTAEYKMINKRPTIFSNYCSTDMMVTSPHGWFESPRYPNQYPHHVTCVWKIRVTPGYRITFRFRDFDVQGDTEKCPDYVEIFDGLASWSPMIKGRYCGKSIPPVIRSATNKLRVTFTSDRGYAGRGFEAIYSEFDPNAAEDDDSRSQFTGIMIGTTCGIIFIVLSVLAVFHTRKIRMRRAQNRRNDVASTLSFDVHQANAPPSYDTVMASPDLYPTADKSDLDHEHLYSDTPHLHREVCRLLGDPDSDEEDPPPAYHGLFPDEEGFVYSFGSSSDQTVGYHRGTPQLDQAEGVNNSGEAKDHDLLQARIWQRRELERIRNSLSARAENNMDETAQSPRPNARPKLERQDTCSSFVTDV